MLINQNSTLNLFNYANKPFLFIALIILFFSRNTFACEVTLAWNNNTDQSVAGYYLYYGTASGQYQANVDVGNKTTCTISGLSEKQRYFFAATAYNVNGDESDFSEEIDCVITPAQIDTDNDGIADETDNCPAVYNPDQSDADSDGIGDGCDDDDTFALVVEAEEMSQHDNGKNQGAVWLMWSNGSMSEEVYFPVNSTYRIEIMAYGTLAFDVGPEMQLLIDQEVIDTVFVNNTSAESFVFEAEIAEGQHELAIAFVNDYYDFSQGIDRNLYVDKTIITLAPALIDEDDDGIADENDNCPTVYNPEQSDADSDGIGDMCDDQDADSILDLEDNCPAASNADQLNSDSDSYGDVCDNCPYTPNPDQSDADSDGIGDGCDDDDTFELVVEAEEMSQHDNGKNQGAVWLMWSNGSMSEEVYFPVNSTYRIEIMAYGALAFDVGPEMQLLIDQEVIDTVFVNNTSAESFVFEAEITEGQHELAIAFVNDYYDFSQGIDRNLYVDKTIITLAPALIDEDDDGIADENDNCPTVYNPEQSDADSDGIGDMCDDDFVEDVPPVITNEPFLLVEGEAAALSKDQEHPTHSDMDTLLVLWTYTDDSASCSDPCDHTLEYRETGQEQWSTMTPENYWIFVWRYYPFVSLGNGNFDLRVSVNDCAGNMTQSDTFYIHIDGLLP